MGHRADIVEVSDRFWRRFRHWALDKGVVTEFHRENPLADSSLGYPGDHIEQAPHAVKRLEGRTIDELLADASKSYRRTLRKAESSGIQVVVDESGERLEDFLRPHRETLDRNGADERFYLDRDYFAMLHREFAGDFAYVYALEDGRATSVEFILFCNDIAYALLGASDAQGLRSGSEQLPRHAGVPLRPVPWSRRLRAHRRSDEHRGRQPPALQAVDGQIRAPTLSHGAADHRSEALLGAEPPAHHGQLLPRLSIRAQQPHASGRDREPDVGGVGMTAQWKVLWAEAATDREEWIGLWSTSAERHPFAHPDVCSLRAPGTDSSPPRS